MKLRRTLRRTRMSLSRIAKSANVLWNHLLRMLKIDHLPISAELLLVPCPRNLPLLQKSEKRSRS